MSVLTQVATDASSLLDALLSFGPAGIMLVLLLTGWLFPKPMIDHLLRENDRLRRDNERVREENSMLRTGIEEKVVPALTRMTDLVDEITKRGV